MSALKEAGWNVVESMAFADHHHYTPRDLTAIHAKMQSAGATAVFTTDKDAVRFQALAPSFPLYRVPLHVAFDPAETLLASVKAVLK